MRSGVVLVCDFQVGLARRVLDVYRLFHETPGIIMITRTIFPDQVSVEVESIPVPVRNLESVRIVDIVLGIFNIFAYLTYLIPTFVRILRKRAAIHVVHAHFVFPQGLFAFLLSRFLHSATDRHCSRPRCQRVHEKSSVARFASRFLTVPTRQLP